MKALAVVSTIFFAVAFGENVSVIFLSNEFVHGVNGIEGPEKLAVNVPTVNFAGDFTSAVTNLLNDFILEYYRQARLTSIIVSNEWKSSTKILLEKTTEVTTNDSTYLDNYLNDVSDGLKTFLLMQPGTQTKNEATFPEFPAQAGPVLTHYENYGPESLFNNLERLVDRDMASIYNLGQQIFLTGWRNVRLALPNLQRQFRHEFLHCTLLKFWIEKMRLIDGTSETLKKRVSLESWSRYMEYSTRVKAVGRIVGLDQDFCQSGV